MSYFTNFTANPGSNVSNGTFQDFENDVTGNNSWVQVLSSMNYTTATGFLSGPASVTSFDAHLSTQTGSDYLTIISGYSATWDGVQETVTTSGSNVYVNNALVGSFSFSGQDLNFSFTSANSNPDILGVLLQSVAYADTSTNRPAFNEQVSFTFGTSNGTVSAPTANIAVGNVPDVVIPAQITFTAPAGNTLTGYANVPTTVMPGAYVQSLNGSWTSNAPGITHPYSYQDVTAVDISIVNPQTGDQLLINPALISSPTNAIQFDSAHGRYSILSGAATAQIGSQGTTINAHQADETVLSTDWVTDILDTIQYENTSGSAPSSVQISVSFATAPESGDNYGAITPPTQYFTINLTPLPSVQAGTVSVTSGGSVAGTAGTAGSGALAGDSDANGYDLSVSAVSGGSLGSAVHGTYGDLTLNADGSFAYVSGANATELGNLAGATGQVTDNFTFTVSDGHGGSVAATLSVNVDDSKPSVTGIGFAFPSTQLGAGESGTIVLAVSNVGAIDTTKGIPTLTLNDGGTATFDAAKSSSSELVFDYTVSAGDTDVGSLAVSSVNLNGAVANASGVVATSAVSIAGLTQHGPQIGSGGGAPADMSTLVTFTGGASSLPQTTLVIDAAGNLYGETTGPQGSTGTIFEIAKTGGLYSGTPGPINTGLMVVDPNDHLVGNATQTLGVVPQSALLIDAAGSVLFSNTVRAGLFTPSQQDASVQMAGANFVAPDVLAAKVGQWAPQIALVTGNEMFVEDELTGRLDVFKGVNASAFEQVNLGNITDVILPVTGVKGAMAVDVAGNVFGTTANGAGSIFELPNNGGTIGAPITLATFNGLNGADPEAGLIADSAGDLFGTTFSGGAFNNGTVFELVKSGSSYTLVTLASFNGTNGANPLGALIEDGAGNLFGTTEAGGANGDGRAGSANSDSSLSGFSA